MLNTKLLLVDTLFGSELWRDLRPELASVAPSVSIEPFNPEPSNTLLATTLAVQVERELRGQTEHSDGWFAVSTRAAAGPIARLTAAGLIEGAVVIDPPAPNVDGSPDVDAMVYASGESPEMMEEIAKHMAPLEGDDDFSDDMIDAMEGAFTGDPVRLRRAALLKHEVHRRGPLQYGPVAGQEDPPELSWIESLLDRTNDLQAWYSSNFHDLGRHVQRNYPDARIEIVDLPGFPWLAAPKELANRLLEWLGPRVDDLR